MNSKEITHEDLLAFIGGEADSETKRQIAAEMKIEGSYTQRWLKRLSWAAGNPFHIQWGHLVSSGEPDEVKTEARMDAAQTSEPKLPRPKPVVLPLPWVVLTLHWQELRARTALGIAALLVGALCRQGNLLCGGMTRGKPSEPPAENDILDTLGEEGAIPLHGHGRYAWLGVEESSVRLKVGESASRTFSSFRVEFRRGAEEIVAAVDAQEGIAVLAADTLQAALDGDADSVVIHVPGRGPG